MVVRTTLRGGINQGRASGAAGHTFMEMAVVPRTRPGLVLAHEATVADNVGREDCC